MLHPKHTRTKTEITDKQLTIPGRHNNVNKRVKQRRGGGAVICQRFQLAPPASPLQQFHQSNQFAERNVKLWNGLPVDRIDFSSLPTFKRSVQCTDLSAVIGKNIVLILYYFRSHFILFHCSVLCQPTSYCVSLMLGLYSCALSCAVVLLVKCKLSCKERIMFFFDKNMFLMFKKNFCVCFVLFKKNIYNILSWSREQQDNAFKLLCELIFSLDGECTNKSFCLRPTKTATTVFCFILVHCLPR